MVLVDSRLGEPATELRAGSTAEGLSGRELDGARCLADYRDAIANGPRDDGASPLEISGVDAFRARADARMKSSEDPLAVGPDVADAPCQLVDYRSGCRDSNDVFQGRSGFRGSDHQMCELVVYGRGGGIRTLDLLNPIQARCQAAPHPEDDSD